jgi:endonuclease/exonuclease/phosphatase family metal-dependent hydrolase
MKIKLLQWNIWYKEDPKNILKKLQEIDADIICLQELTNSSDSAIQDIPKYLAKNLKLHHYFQTANEWVYPDKTESIGNGIFSKFPLKNPNFVFVKDPNQNTQDLNKEGRVYIEAEIELNGTTLTIATTHLSYTKKFFDNNAKKKEVGKLIQILKTKKGNYIFTGDLNSLPNSYTIKNISRYLKNAGPPLTQPTWTTKPFNYDEFLADKLNWRLDYVFTTDAIKVISATIINTQFSDHLPVLIEFGV